MPILAAVCAAVGALVALGIARTTGVFDGAAATTTIVAAPVPAPTTGAAAPVTAGGFAAAQVFRDRSPGVVTVFSFFGGTAAQGSGFVVDRAGTILTNAHVITNAGETAGAVSAASNVYVEFPDRDRVAARIVGWAPARLTGFKSRLPLRDQLGTLWRR